MSGRNHYGARPYARRRRTGRCARCQETKRLQARGCCGACYEALRKTGDHIDYDRVHRSSEDLLVDYEHLRSAGLAHDQIAARLGYANGNSLTATLWHARRRVQAVAA
ncbi:hypothetical protein ACGFIY_21050 [Micromonospora chersina]|uniref:hypothetical protein n=1 Tax=Micromonospora chersina TaxID=47854 RepID=UPI003721DF78